MNKSLIFGVTVFALWMSPAHGQNRPAPTVIGRKALDHLLAENFPELITMFNNVMKANLTLEVLHSRVASELEGFGKVESVGEPIWRRDETRTLISFPVVFSKTKVNIELDIDGSGQLAAIHFRPPDSPLPPGWQHPSYSQPKSFREREVSLGSAPWRLGGTLTVPIEKGPFPALVLVHGPGPNDRDESIRANKVFADIAEGLSSRGIAVLRYDKRSKAYGHEMSENEFTLREETIDDALSAAAFLRLQPEVSPSQVYLLGHSLGGYAAPRIARQDGKLAGLIFLAANARPIEEVVLDETEYLAAAGVLQPDQARNRLNYLKIEMGKIKALQPGAENPPVVMGLPSAWLLDVRGYDPAAQASRLSIPLLFLQGERDFQVSMKDFDRWRSALANRSNASFRSYPDLNHLFMHGEGTSVPTEYLTPGNVSSAVIDDIAKWIAASKN